MPARRCGTAASAATAIDPKIQKGIAATASTPSALQPPQRGANAPSARPLIALPEAVPRSASECSCEMIPMPPDMTAAEPTPSSRRAAQSIP